MPVPTVTTVYERANALFQILHALQQQQYDLRLRQIAGLHGDGDQADARADGEAVSFQTRLKELKDAEKVAWDENTDLHDEVKKLLAAREAAAE